MKTYYSSESESVCMLISNLLAFQVDVGTHESFKFTHALESRRCSVVSHPLSHGNDTYTTMLKIQVKILA